MPRRRIMETRKGWDHSSSQNLKDYNATMAKQRASVSWIVQKAHKNKVPLELQEPFYCDYEGQEHLKPAIVHRLANADLYCSALANIYSDPNFHNLSHGSIIQALARKNIFVVEPTDVSLSETMLIQTTPLKISAHLAIIEGIMALYVREVIAGDRVSSVLQQLGWKDVTVSVQEQEKTLVSWINAVMQVLQDRINKSSQDSCKYPTIRGVSDLTDGLALAAIISLYCPKTLSWNELSLGDTPDSVRNVDLVVLFCRESLPYNPCLLTKEDILYMNASLKQNMLAFIAELFFLMELEPVPCATFSSGKKANKFQQLSSGFGAWSAYQRSTNVIPDLRDNYSSNYNVSRSSSTNFIQHTSVRGTKPAAGLPSVRRSNSMDLGISEGKRTVTLRSDKPVSSSEYGVKDGSMIDDQENEFVVQRSKGVATLSNLLRSHSPLRVQDSNVALSPVSSSRERDEGSEDPSWDYPSLGGGGSSSLSRRGSFNSTNDLPAAGVPSRFDAAPHGRCRSRRNSISADESQLTIENFGGSQDNLNMIARNPDKEPYVPLVLSGKFSGSQSDLLSAGRRDSIVKEKVDWYRPSMEEPTEIDTDEEHNKKFTSFDGRGHSGAEIHKVAKVPRPSGSPSDTYHLLNRDGETIQSMSFAEEERYGRTGGAKYLSPTTQPSIATSVSGRNGEKKMSSFAAMPNRTTWKQHAQESTGNEGGNGRSGDVDMEPQVMASELHNVRLKLEEKRRHIETEKQRIELSMSRQRQKLGKEAFMQAVSKGGNNGYLNDSPYHHSELSDSLVDSVEQSLPNTSSEHVNSVPRSNLGLKLKELDSTELNQLSKKWLDLGMPTEELPTPELDAMDYDDYHRSMVQMSDSLTEIQGDIHRLSHQQSQIQSLMQNGMSPAMHQSSSSQYYKPDQGSPVRRVWGAVPMNESYMAGVVPPSPRRQQWGQVRRGDYVMAGQTYQGYPNVPPHMMANPQNGGRGFILHGAGSQIHSLPPHIIQQNGHNLYTGEPIYGSPDHSALQSYQADSPRPATHAPFRLHGGDGRSRDNSMVSKGTSRLSDYVAPSAIKPPAAKSPSPARSLSQTHVPVSVPSRSEMEPQNVSFIGGSEAAKDEPERLSLSPGGGSSRRISSGSKTYRIAPHEPGSPTRPSLGTRTFRVPTKKGLPVEEDPEDPYSNVGTRSPSPPYSSFDHRAENSESEVLEGIEPLQEGVSPDKGFYVSFDDDNALPKKSKPVRTSGLGKLPLRTKSNDNELFPANDDDISAYMTPNRRSIDAAPSLSGGLVHSLKSGRHTSPPHLSHKEMSPPANGHEMSPLFPDEVHNRSMSGHGKTKAIILDDVQSAASIEMEKRKERLMLMALRRKQEQEEAKRKIEMEANETREKEKRKEEERLRKKEEERSRREAILESYKMKKAMEEAEKEGRHYEPPPGFTIVDGGSRNATVRLRNKTAPRGRPPPRPRTMYAGNYSEARDDEASVPVRGGGKKGSMTDIPSQVLRSGSRASNVRSSTGRWGSSQSLYRTAGPSGSTHSLTGAVHHGSTKNVNDYSVHESGRPSLNIASSGLRPLSRYPNRKKFSSTGNLIGVNEPDNILRRVSDDSSIGGASRRVAPPPGGSSYGRSQLPSPCGPGSLPPGLYSKQRGHSLFDDAASDVSSNASTNMDFYGPRLFKQPTSKSNRTIILNAVEYCIFPGVVNQSAKLRVLEEIGRSEAQYFLVLFRDVGCQFRALYSYDPETEDVYKLYGTGPKQVNERMFERFYKYNSGGKCFAQIHTKHLTVTIDAFTIHNSLWQGKKVNLISKKDMTLVI